MATYNDREAKAHFSKLLRRVMEGEEIIITLAGKPIAILKPMEKPLAERVPGNDAGRVIIHPDFDAPLPEFET